MGKAILYNAITAKKMWSQNLLPVVFVCRNLQNCFRMHKFLKIFSPRGENHSQKNSKSDGYFPENHCLLRGIPVGQMKRQKITKSSKIPKIFSECIDWEVKITTRKPANLVDFFQKITAAHHPEAACFIVALAHKTDANFSRNLQIFFWMNKFLKIF